MSLLERVVNSMKETAAIADVEIVTGDTKVVKRGSVDNLYINTCGIGIVNNGVNLSISRIEIGDKIIISGTIGDHGLAVISERESLGFNPPIKSDCAPLSNLIGRLINSGANIKFMRDPTRGGLATTLNEIVNTQKYGIVIEEQNIPINSNVRALCEILGYDPLYIANEGKVVIVASANDAAKVCDPERRRLRLAPFLRHGEGRPPPARPTSTAWPRSPTPSSTSAWPRACPSPASTAACWPTAPSAARRSRARSTPAARPASSSCWAPTRR